MPEPPSGFVPGTFDPERQRTLASDVRRLIRAAEWLATELDQQRGCHAALTQVSALQADLDAISERLVDGHLRYCVAHAVDAGRSADEIQAMLTPLRSLIFMRR